MLKLYQLLSQLQLTEFQNGTRWLSAGIKRELSYLMSRLCTWNFLGYRWIYIWFRFGLAVKGAPVTQRSADQVLLQGLFSLPSLRTVTVELWTMVSPFCSACVRLLGLGWTWAMSRERLARESHDPGCTPAQSSFIISLLECRLAVSQKQNCLLRYQRPHIQHGGVSWVTLPWKWAG